jgi:hypothetical protein
MGATYVATNSWEVGKYRSELDKFFTNIETIVTNYKSMQAKMGRGIANRTMQLNAAQCISMHFCTRFNAEKEK